MTFDRFDGGLLLARPSSVAPANSLANLFNMDVQPGGWLRSRANWRRAVQGSGVLSLGSGVYSLRSNGGYLWAFALSSADTPGDYSNSSEFGRLYPLDNSDYMAIGYFSNGDYVGAGRLAGAAPWNSGFVAVMYNLETDTWHKAAFAPLNGLGGAYSSVTRTDITDENMPNSGLMVTIQSRIYAISDDGQTVRFCKIGDPTDWTTASNAGFLPVAQHFGSGQRAYALGVYQGKLAVFTDKSVQLWTVDPDPTAMAIENVVDGIGSRHHESLVSLNGDLLFLSDTGIRSLTTLSNSLFPSEVDIGLPVKPLAISPALVGGTATVAPHSDVLGLAATPFGQYWIAAPNNWSLESSSERGWLAWSYSRQAKLNAWAWHGAGSPRAKFKGWAVLGNRIFARTDAENYLLVMTPEVFTEDQTTPGAYAQCAMKTQWLDFGKPGVRKVLTGIDFDGVNIQTIDISVSAGGDRHGILAETVQVGEAQNGWTYSGELIPLAVDGTEFRISFSGGGVGETQLNRFTLHFDPVSG